MWHCEHSLSPAQALEFVECKAWTGAKYRALPRLRQLQHLTMHNCSDMLNVLAQVPALTGLQVRYWLSIDFVAAAAEDAMNDMSLALDKRMPLWISVSQHAQICLRLDERHPLTMLSFHLSPACSSAAQFVSSMCNVYISPASEHHSFTRSRTHMLKCSPVDSHGAPMHAGAGRERMQAAGGSASGSAAAPADSPGPERVRAADRSAVERSARLRPAAAPDHGQVRPAAFPAVQPRLSGRPAISGLLGLQSAAGMFCSTASCVAAYQEELRVLHIIKLPYMPRSALIIVPSCLCHPLAGSRKTSWTVCQCWQRLYMMHGRGVVLLSMLTLLLSSQPCA